jgi:hypothetical protein
MEPLDHQVLRVLNDLIAYMEGKGMFIAPPQIALKKEWKRSVLMARKVSRGSIRD